MGGSIFTETPNLIIKHISSQDFCAIRELQRNDLSLKYFGAPLSDEKIASNFNDLLMDHFNHCGFSISPVFLKSTGEFIGKAGLVHLDFDRSNPDLELGYFLLPQFWGRKYASELARALIPLAFELGAPRVYATIDRANVASCRVSEKLGMKLEGEREYGTLEDKPLLYYVAYPDWSEPKVGDK
ncbi:MAG: GNAT family N-acetyltransferase [Gammaproteobacteria bacterium]|nr:GNAT family N-acetyltransferase [Gammaproteobacteria bacterium]